MAALMYMIFAVFTALSLGAPALFVALSFECDSPSKQRVRQASGSLQRATGLEAQRAAA